MGFEFGTLQSRDDRSTILLWLLVMWIALLCGCQLAAQAESFAARHDPGDFGRAAYHKSGDGVLHVLARGGHVDCLRFLVEVYSGREHVDIEIR